MPQIAALSYCCSIYGVLAQEIAAPGTPPPQARMSRFGAAQAGRQGTGQASAAQHGDQPPTGPDQRMQEANPYRSLGKPSFPFTASLLSALSKCDGGSMSGKPWVSSFDAAWP